MSNSLPSSGSAPPPEFGPYRLLRELGVGGMAVVYLAEKKGMKGFSKRVALKILHDHHNVEKEFAPLFIGEARLGGLLSHPNIVETHDFGQHDGRLYLAMEFVDGPTLNQILVSHRSARVSIPLDITLQLLIQVCRGLHYAHRALDYEGRPLRMVHRDLKPSNILISRHGQAKIADFGVARAESNVHQTQYSGMIKGTVRYLSPEQAWGRRDLDWRSDLFTLGLILFEFLTLRHLYKGETPEAIIRDAQDVEEAVVRPRLEALPAGALRGPLLELLEKALAPDREKRFQSAGAMGDAMETILACIPDRTKLIYWLKNDALTTQQPGSPGIVNIAPSAPSADLPNEQGAAPTTFDDGIHPAKALHAPVASGAPARSGSEPPVVRLETTAELPDQGIPEAPALDNAPKAPTPASESAPASSKGQIQSLWHEAPWELATDPSLSTPNRRVPPTKVQGSGNQPSGPASSGSQPASPSSLGSPPSSAQPSGSASSGLPSSSPQAVDSGPPGVAPSAPRLSGAPPSGSQSPGSEPLLSKPSDKPPAPAVGGSLQTPSKVAPSTGGALSGAASPSKLSRWRRPEAGAHPSAQTSPLSEKGLLKNAAGASEGPATPSLVGKNEHKAPTKTSEAPAPPAGKNPPLSGRQKAGTVRPGAVLASPRASGRSQELEPTPRPAPVSAAGTAAPTSKPPREEPVFAQPGPPGGGAAGAELTPQQALEKARQQGQEQARSETGSEASRDGTADAAKSPPSAVGTASGATTRKETAASVPGRGQGGRVPGPRIGLPLPKPLPGPTLARPRARPAVPVEETPPPEKVASESIESVGSTAEESSRPSFESSQPSFESSQPSFESSQPSFESSQPSFESSQPSLVRPVSRLQAASGERAGAGTGEEAGPQAGSGLETSQSPASVFTPEPVESAAERRVDSMQSVWDLPAGKRRAGHTWELEDSEPPVQEASQGEDNLTLLWHSATTHLHSRRLQFDASSQLFDGPAAGPELDSADVELSLAGRKSGGPERLEKESASRSEKESTSRSEKESTSRSEMASASKTETGSPSDLDGEVGGEPDLFRLRRPVSAVRESVDVFSSSGARAAGERETGHPFFAASSQSAPGRRAADEEFWVPKSDAGEKSVDQRLEEGFGLLRQGDYEGARRVWEEAIALDPENRLIRSNLRMLKKRLEAGVIRKR